MCFREDDDGSHPERTAGEPAGGSGLGDDQDCAAAAKILAIGGNRLAMSAVAGLTVALWDVSGLGVAAGLGWGLRFSAQGK